jgi:hypothetical protein
MTGLSTEQLRELVARVREVVGPWEQPQVGRPEVDAAVDRAADSGVLVDGFVAPVGEHGGYEGMFSGKKHVSGVNVQVVADLDGRVADVGDPAPGARHDSAAFFVSGIAERWSSHYAADGPVPSADTITTAAQTYGVTLVTPALLDQSPQAHAGTGFDKTAFSIDFDTRQVTCPQGNTSASWSPASQRGTPRGAACPASHGVRVRLLLVRDHRRHPGAGGGRRARVRAAGRRGDVQTRPGGAPPVAAAHDGQVAAA